MTVESRKTIEITKNNGGEGGEENREKGEKKLTPLPEGKKEPSREGA